MKLILVALFVLQSIFSFSQEYRLDRETLPAYLIKGETDTIGIVFSIEDVQKIDTNLELLEHFENLNNKLDTTIYYYISLTNSQDQKIHIQTLKIVNLTSKIFERDETIRKLKLQILEEEKINANNETIIDGKDKIIDQYKKELNKERTKTSIAIILGIILIVVVGVL